MVCYIRYPGHSSHEGLLVNIAESVKSKFYHIFELIFKITTKY